MNIAFGVDRASTNTNDARIGLIVGTFTCGHSRRCLPHAYHKAAKALADLVRPKLGEKDLKVNILELAHRFKHSTGIGHKEKGLGIEQLQHYCDKAAKSAQPEWQIIALAQGWTPPASGASAKVK